MFFHQLVQSDLFPLHVSNNMSWEKRTHQESIRPWLVPSVSELKYNTAIREIIKLGKGRLGWVILPSHFVVCKIHTYALYYFLFIAFSSDSQGMRAISCLKPFLPTVWAPSCLTWGKSDIQPCIARTESSKLQLQKAVGLFPLEQLHVGGVRQAMNMLPWLLRCLFVVSVVLEVMTLGTRQILP